jgi:hypothetical protein
MEELARWAIPLMAVAAGAGLNAFFGESARRKERELAHAKLRGAIEEQIDSVIHDVRDLTKVVRRLEAKLGSSANGVDDDHPMRVATVRQ